MQSIKDAQTAAEQAIDTAKQQAVQAAQAEAEKAATSAGQAASSAAEAAQSATNAAAEVGKVQSAGTSAVQAVQAAQNTATEAVSAAQQTATQTVSEAQATAVSAVQEAGTTQTSAVASAASSALTNISGAKDAALSDVAEAGAAQVSAIGTAGADAVEDVNDAKTAALEAIDAANAALPAPTAADAGKALAVKPDGTGYQLAGPYAPLSAAIRPTASGNPISITDSVEWPLQGLKVYGKSVQDGTPSPESPVPIVSAGASGSIETTITGKNLLTGRRYYGQYSGGYAFILNKTAVSLPYTPIRENDGICQTVSVKKGKTYTFSVTNPNTNASLLFALYKTFEDTSESSRAISKAQSAPTVSITPSEDGILVCLIAGTWTSGTTTIHECTASELLQLEIGSTATAYEAPHSQSIVATTPNGLPGIPVDPGGNYTDADGQQSACDVKDYGTGKYTQMVGLIESYNGENITTPYMSATGQLSTGAEVYYVLDEPVVTDISADELAAYRALHTYDGSTVISTPEDVTGIEVRYVADGEKYIDRKISEAIASAAETKLAAYDTLSGAIHEGVNEA